MKKNKNILAIDSSSPTLSIALSKGPDAIASAELPGMMHHAENLLPMIDKLLKKSKLGIQDIDSFLINSGPGSFTGLRMGFSTLKGFITSQKRPCYGGMHLDLIAQNIQTEEGTELAVCNDARRQKIFTRFYRYGAKGWEAQGNIQLFTIKQLQQKLRKHMLVTGDALKRYSEEFDASAKKKELALLPETFWYPKAAHLIAFYYGKPKLKWLTPLKTAKDFIPLYYRLTEAEERLNKRANSRSK